MPKIITRFANYTDPHDAQLIGDLLDAYSRDQMGGATPLPAWVKQNLAAELSKRPYAFTVLAEVEGVAAGLVNAFEGFSTFQCKPLINIHDVIVLDRFRGSGISRAMLERVEQVAIEKGCCKLTLEVLEGNQVAQCAYQRFGFSGYQLDAETGKALFWQKPL